MTRDEAKEKIINDFCKCRVWCELYPDLCQTESCEIWWALKALSDRPTGKWVGAREFCQHLEEVTGEKYQVTGIGNMIYCNQCWQASRRRSKYCPNCGSYNGGEQDE